MSVGARRFTETISITGASQEAVTDYMYGIVDQIIIQSSVDGQAIDLILLNTQTDQIYRNEGIDLPNSTKPRNDLRPRLLPRGPLTIRIQNPINVSGTITVTLIEQEYV